MSQVQPDVDAQLIDLFDGSRRQREFARVMRGYDTHQVNSLLARLDAELERQQEQIEALERDLADAHRQLEERRRPAPGLGSHIEELIQVAEEKASDLLGVAQSQAEAMTEAARAEAAEVRGAAMRDVEAMLLAAEQATEALKAEAGGEAAIIKTAARTKGESIKADARREAAAERERGAAAAAQAEEIRENARRLGLQIVTNAELTADQIVAEAKKMLADARAEAQRIWAAAHDHAHEMSKHQEGVPSSSNT